MEKKQCARSSEFTGAEILHANNAFYDTFGKQFDKILFDDIITGWFCRYLTTLPEIRSWISDQALGILLTGFKREDMQSFALILLKKCAKCAGRGDLK